MVCNLFNAFHVRVRLRETSLSDVVISQAHTSWLLYLHGYHVKLQHQGYTEQHTPDINIQKIAH